CRRHEDRQALEDATHDRRSVSHRRRRSVQAAAGERLSDGGEKDQRSSLTGSRFHASSRSDNAPLSAERDDSPPRGTGNFQISVAKSYIIEPPPICLVAACRLRRV